ncbi:MAG: hypothetical protein IPJ76_08290 [Flavobacteriales bacterium]|nr:MAG: hypothetical protein IPJ76_08290 [Flavobacteriales bacterium]
MIVRGMTIEEAVRDAQQDARALVNKAMPHTKAMEHALKAGGRTGKRRIERDFNWRSPRGNEWCIKLITTKKGTSVAALVRYHGRDVRLRAIRVDLLGTNGEFCHIHYTAHFLERYMVRFNTNKNPIERLAEFFQANHTPAFHTLADEGNNVYEVMAGMSQGVGFGQWNKTTGISKLHTFVDFGKLDAEQQMLAEGLDLKLYFNNFTVGQRERMMREVEAEAQRQAAQHGDTPEDVAGLVATMRRLANMPGSQPRT